jgi:hypothetical protein
MTLPLLDAGRYAAAASMDSDASAFITRITSPPDSTRQNLINDFFVSIKANIGLAKFDAIYLFAAHDSQTSLLNLRQNAYNCTAENTPTFTTDSGYNGVGADGRLNTGFNPSSAAGRVHVQNDSHISAWSLTAASQSTGALWGQVSSLNLSSLPRLTSTAYFRHHHATTDDTVASSDGSGLWMTSRGASANFVIYRNGSSLGTKTRTSTTPNNSNIIFLDVSSENSWPGRVAAASIGSNLTSGEATSLYNAMLAYLQGVGAV